MSSKPTFLLLPGGFQVPSIYDPIRASLSQHSYPSTSPSLPSNSKVAIKDPNADVIAIQAALTELIDVEAKDVVVVVHSYSGLPGTEAVKGFAKPDRKALGKEGGVVALIVIMSFLLPAGSNVAPNGDLSLKPSFVNHDDKTGLNTIPPATFRELFFNDMPMSEADKWIATMLPQSQLAYSVVTSYEAYKFVPTTYIICEKDKVMPPGAARMAIDLARSNGADNIKVETCDAGHFCILSQAEWTAKVLMKAADEAML